MSKNYTRFIILYKIQLICYCQSFSWNSSRSNVKVTAKYASILKLEFYNANEWMSEKLDWRMEVDLLINFVKGCSSIDIRMNDDFVSPDQNILHFRLMNSFFFISNPFLTLHLTTFVVLISCHHGDRWFNPFFSKLNFIR